MARYLALEWDLHEARVVQARTRGSDVIVEDAYAVDLKGGTEGATTESATAAERLANALASKGVGSTDTLIAVGRASIELRMLSLPPSPEEELPDMVRFQAMRQFATIGEDWPLDFIPVETRDDGGHNVLAAAIAPELVKQIEETCKACHLTPERLVLRPFAAASLLRRRPSLDSTSCLMMVDLLTDEADLTVLINGRVSFTRTVRLPAHGDGSAAMLGELRRTIAAAHNQLRGQRVELVLVFGDGADHATLKSLIESQLSLKVLLADPFDDLSLSRELRDRRPQHPGRFAPLLGMLLDEASGQGQSIDFLHPRKRPVPPNTRRRKLLLGTTAGALLLALLILFFGKIRSLDNEIAALQQTSKNLETGVEKAKLRQSQAAEVGRFEAGDVTWLDELRELSTEFPPAEQAIVTQLSLKAASPGGGELTLQGYASEPSVIADLEQQLRDERHVVEGNLSSEDQQRSAYRWQYSEIIRIAEAVPQPTPSVAVPTSATVPEAEEPEPENDRPQRSAAAPTEQQDLRTTNQAPQPEGESS